MMKLRRAVVAASGCFSRAVLTPCRPFASATSGGTTDDAPVTKGEFGKFVQVVNAGFADMKSAMERQGAAIEKHGAAIEKHGAAIERQGAAIEKLSRGFFEMKTDLADVKSAVKRLSSTNPLLLARDLKKLLVRVPDEADAVHDGAIATWTWVRHQSRLFAVGCVHCALYYRTLTSNRMFVSVPADVVKRDVIRTYFPVHVQKLPQSALRTSLDVVAVEVPDDATVSAISWPAPLTLPRGYGCVVGASHSSIVSGEGALVGEKLTEGASGVFVETAGEPGQSGTLMHGYDLDTDAVVPLGLYCGVVNGRSKLKPRGRVAPFPALASMKAYTVVAPPKTLVVADKKQKSKRTCSITVDDSGVTYLKDKGHLYPGVVVEGYSKYCGALDIGSCRAQ